MLVNLFGYSTVVPVQSFNNSTFRGSSGNGFVQKIEIKLRGIVMMKKSIITIAMIIAIAVFSGCGSLMRSASRGDLDGVKHYVEKGADVNQYDRWGWTPIMWAIYYNYYDVVKYMLENKADPNARTKYDYGSILKDSTPLIIAATYGYGGIARQLLLHGANPKLLNRQGESAIIVAERYNFIEIVNLIEGKGATTPGIKKWKRN
jgi:ankyrin repeat protein